MRRRNLVWWLGNGMVGLGVALFLAVGAFQLYAAVAQAQLDRYVQGLDAEVATADLLEDRMEVPQPEAATPEEMEDRIELTVVPHEEDLALAELAADADRVALLQRSMRDADWRPILADSATVLLRSARDADWRRLRRFIRLPKEPPIRLVVPSVEIDSRIVEIGTKIENGVWVWETADHAVGHHKGTGLPGRPGNVVLSGHISSPLKGEGNVFRRLPDIEVGDRFRLYTADGSAYDYKVTRTRVVLPTDIGVMDPTPDETATLITCVPDWVYTHRLVVTGKRVKSNE